MEIVRERMWNVGMKLSISNIAWKKEHDKEMYQVCRDMGYHGIEIAPSRIFGKYPYKNMKEAYEYRDELKKLYHLEVSSVQSIWYGKQGFLFKEDYDLFVDYTYQVIRFASQLGAGNIVFGSPEIRRIFQPEDYQKGMKFFVNISRYADKYNTVFSIEANPAVYGTNYINETLEAVDIVKRIGSEHLKVNLDIGTIICNDEGIDRVVENIALIHHVHFSEPYLMLLKERQIHKEIIKILKDAEYKNYISIEMKCQENLEDVKRVMEYVCLLNDT